MILYKKDTKGKIRVLDVHSEGPALIQKSGILGTNNPIVHMKMCKAKNIGRSNATTPEEQALCEMQSVINEKLSEGYFKTKEQAETIEVILPMLAKKFEDEKRKIDWTNCYAQPKLDGMRALGDKELISREGKEITTVPHLTKIIPFIDVHLDGELYAHGLSFQENMSLIKKYRSGETEKVMYHVYDIISNKPFYERYVDLSYAVRDIPEIILVPITKITNVEELNKAHAKNIANGYEGTMIRWGKEGYKVNGRSSNLLKKKDWQDIALPIKDITPNDAEPTHGTPHFEYKGATFKAGVKLSHSERAYMLANKEEFIGKIAELRFFEYSDEGVPRFPVMVGIREDKSKGDK